MVGRKLTLLFLLQLFYLTGCRCSAKNSPTPQLDGGEAKATAVRPGKAKKTKPICWPKGEGSLWNRHEAVRPKNEEEERLDLPFAAEVLAWEHRSTGSIFVGFDPATASKEAWLTALNEQGARRFEAKIESPDRYFDSVQILVSESRQGGWLVATETSKAGQLLLVAAFDENSSQIQWSYKDVLIAEGESQYSAFLSAGLPCVSALTTTSRASSKKTGTASSAKSSTSGQLQIFCFDEKFQAKRVYHANIARKDGYIPTGLGASMSSTEPDKGTLWISFVDQAEEFSLSEPDNSESATVPKMIDASLYLENLQLPLLPIEEEVRLEPRLTVSMRHELRYKFKATADGIWLALSECPDEGGQGPCLKFQSAHDKRSFSRSLQLSSAFENIFDLVQSKESQKNYVLQGDDEGQLSLLALETNGLSSVGELGIPPSEFLSMSDDSAYALTRSGGNSYLMPYQCTVTASDSN